MLFSSLGPWDFHVVHQTVLTACSKPGGMGDHLCVYYWWPNKCKKKKKKNDEVHLKLEPHMFQLESEIQIIVTAVAINCASPLPPQVSLLQNGPFESVTSLFSQSLSSCVISQFILSQVALSTVYSIKLHKYQVKVIYVI